MTRVYHVNVVRAKCTKEYVWKILNISINLPYFLLHYSVQFSYLVGGIYYFQRKYKRGLKTYYNILVI